MEWAEVVKIGSITIDDLSHVAEKETFRDSPIVVTRASAHPAFEFVACINSSIFGFHSLKTALDAGSGLSNEPSAGKYSPNRLSE
jgi:hypothetical protein